MSPDTIRKDPAFPAMTLDLLNNVLVRADNPVKLVKYLAEELRELTGARCILFIQCMVNSISPYRVMDVNPARRSDWAESSAAGRLYEIVNELRDIQLWRPDDCSEASGLLQEAGFGLSIVVPLNIGNDRVGAMLVLGLPDEHHIETEIRLLNTLSTIVALVLRTAFLFENQEQIIQERTKDLQIELAARNHAEEEVRNLKNYLANIIDSMPALLVGMDRNETVTQWNRQAEKSTGIPAAEALGRQLEELIPDFSPWIEALQREIEQRRPASMEKLLIEKQGERYFYDLMLYPLITNCVEGTVVKIEDVTNRTRIQELMIQTEKMMSIGGLAAGMAHEINNPLGIITQAVQNIVRRISPELPVNQKVAAEFGVNLDGLSAYFEQRQIPEFIASIREAAGRASRIIVNMLRFSRQAEITMAPASLATIMEQALELAASDYDLKKKYDFRGIEIVRDVAPDMPDVPMVETEIEQVLLNLLKNAAQAMIANPPGQKPRIVLHLKQEERYAVLEVEDNGPGMTEDIRRRVFEPFFTTKEPGIGTGLGLSVSYMIVTQNHKGLMEVASSPGNGARFTVMLPLYTENPHE